MKKIILLLAFCFLGGLLKSQSFDPNQLADSRMPIFDNLFNCLQSSPNLNNIITEPFYNALFSERGNNFIFHKLLLILPLQILPKLIK